MNRLLAVRLNKSHHDKLQFLYNLYRIESKTDTERFRILLDAIYSEKINPSDTPTLSTTQHENLELLKDWDCAYRALVPVWNKFKQRDEMKIHCSATDTRRILGTNIIDISICKKCHDRGASTNFIAIPAPKKPEKPQPAAKPQPVQKQERKCVECGNDISKLEEWKTLCYSCWRKKQNPAWQGEKEPLQGSPADLRKREADAIRRANEKINEINDEPREKE